MNNQVKTIEQIERCTVYATTSIVISIASIGIASDQQVYWLKALPYLIMGFSSFFMVKSPDGVIEHIVKGKSFINNINKLVKNVDRLIDLRMVVESYCLETSKSNHKLDGIQLSLNQLSNSLNHNNKVTEADIVEMKDIEDILNMHKTILQQNERNLQCKEAEREHKLNETLEFAILFFLIKGTAVDAVEKVCVILRQFIKTREVPIIKGIHIPYNKKIRKGELYQFLRNMFKHNKIVDSDLSDFAKHVFGEWYYGDKNNLSRNYPESELPKQSLATGDGIVADLEKLYRYLEERETPEYRKDLRDRLSAIMKRLEVLEEKK